MTAKQGRKTLIIPGIVGSDISENCFIIKTGLRVAFPGIYGKATRASSIFGRRLAETEITLATISPQFDKHNGALRGDEIVSKKNVFGPRAHAINARTEIARRQFRNVKWSYVHKSFSSGLARHEDGVVPFIALRIELREIVPLRFRFERIEAGVACE